MSDMEKPRRCSCTLSDATSNYQCEKAFCVFFKSQRSKMSVLSFHEKELLRMCGFIVNKIH